MEKFVDEGAVAGATAIDIDNRVADASDNGSAVVIIDDGGLAGAIGKG
jgi:hypothetical protein